MECLYVKRVGLNKKDLKLAISDLVIFTSYLGQKLATIKNNNIDANSRPLSSAIFALSEIFVREKLVQ